MFHDSRCLAYTVVTLALTLWPATRTEAQTITFEDITGGTDFSANGHVVLKNYTSIITEQGYSFSTNSASPFAAWTSDAPAFYGGDYTGSIALVENSNGGSISLTKVGGIAFTLNSIDIANAYTQSSTPGAAGISFTGTKQGGGTVSLNYLPPFNDSLHTVTFNDFTNVVSVTWTQSNPFHQFDNLVLNAGASSTPEPGSMALFTSLGLSGTGFALYRRRCRQAGKRKS